MTTASLCIVKNEVDILPFTLPRMAAQVDRLYVADNGSTDGTRDLLDELARSLPLVVVARPGQFEDGRIFTDLANMAAARGAKWVLPHGADEVWWSPDGRLGDLLDGRPAGESVCWGLWHEHIRTGTDDPNETDPIRAMVWSNRAGTNPRMAVRWAPGASIKPGAHSVNHPRGMVGETLLRMCHYSIRDVGCLAKRAGYELPAGGQAGHWRKWSGILGMGGMAALEVVYEREWWADDPVAAKLTHCTGGVG